MEGINAIAMNGNLDVLALYSGDEEEYGVFFWTQGPAFPLYHVAPTDLGLLHRRLPRYFALSNGVVKATWATLPTEQEAVEVLGSGQS